MKSLPRIQTLFPLQLQEMKFGKEFSSQMVQEWQGAYMDYNSLKNRLKDILIFRQRHALQPSPGPAGRSRSLKRRLTIYRAFSGLTRGSLNPTEDEVILVSSVQKQGSDNQYQTMFLKSSEEGGEYELVFFRRLDEQFNKVVKFYKEKVEEMKLEAEGLNKQMDALIALRIKVDKPYVQDDRVARQFKVASATGNSAPATVVASVNGVKQG